jgi:hypothetical protein
VRRPWTLLAAAGCSILATAVCSDPTHEFRVVALEEARTRLSSGAYTLVSAALPEPNPDKDEDEDGNDAGALQIAWEQPPGTRRQLAELPAGPLLIIASSNAAGYRSAAAAARARPAEVLVFISESAEERRTLYAPIPVRGASS